MANLDTSLVEAQGLGEAFDNGEIGAGIALELSNTFSNTGDILVLVENGSAGAITVTLEAVPSALNARGSSANDVVKALAAGEVGIFTPASPGEFGVTATLTASGVDADLKAILVRLRPFVR
jgi:hypothetical protein